MAQMVKNLLVTQEAWVRSLGQEGPLEKEMATHSGGLPRCPVQEPTCQCRRHKRHGFHPWVGKIPRRRARQPTLVFLPGESHGQRSLVGYSPWGHKEWDTAEWLTLSLFMEKAQNCWRPSAWLCMPLGKTSLICLSYNIWIALSAYSLASKIISLYCDIFLAHITYIGPRGSTDFVINIIHCLRLVCPPWGVGFILSPEAKYGQQFRAPDPWTAPTKGIERFFLPLFSQEWASFSHPPPPVLIVQCHWPESSHVPTSRATSCRQGNAMPCWLQPGS